MPESPEYLFDRQLSSILQEFNDVLKVGSQGHPEGAARDALKARAAEIANLLATTTPPDPEWRDLVTDYLELMNLHLQYFGEVLPEDAQRRFAVVNQRATDHRERLRNVYRSRA